MYVCTYSLDGVGTAGPAQHRDSVVLLIGVQLQSHLIGGHAKGGDHLTDAAGERLPERQSDITDDITTFNKPLGQCVKKNTHTQNICIFIKDSQSEERKQ